MIKKSQGQLYHKLFYTYNAIIILIVLFLMFYFTSESKQRILNTNLNYMEMLNERGVSYLQESLNVADTINQELHQSQAVLEDMLSYLSKDEENYQRYRLDTFIKSSSFQYVGLGDFADNALASYPSLAKIEILSYKREEITAYYPGGRISRNHTTEEMWKAISEEKRDEYGSFSYQKEIRNPGTLESVGRIIFSFNTKSLENMKKSIPLPDMSLVNSAGILLYTSDENVKNGEQGYLENPYSIKGSIQQYVLYTSIEKLDAKRIPLPTFLTILLIGIGLILGGGACVHFYLNRLNGRLNYILEGMNQITTGDLTVRLDNKGGGDELDVISEHFNEMCEKLERYIQQSYLAEIEQKNAEMEVLQNQINPHFLYNTLEAIRMKAICNGDREVGKMLYSMAVIFRSQLKDADIITLIQEIHYCKKYLELFEYRYTENFSFDIRCDEELMEIPIMKFILQPILENYFVHGIRSEQAGNHIDISVEKQEEILLIHVIDNGRGMTEEELNKKNRELLENGDGSRKSIGLANVNRRLKAVYGQQYGIFLQSNITGGLHVLLKAGIQEKTKDDKKNNAD